MGAFVQELFRVGLYKRSQGRVARQVTFAALWIIVALATWRLVVWLSDHAYPQTWMAAPLAVFAAGSWAAFRVVQMPQFAEFLISVEGEMNKVTWPKRTELFRASIVVMVVIFLLAGIFGWLLD